ncbi:alpha/beta hydrolase [Parasphingorhabdus sp.]|uniref:alpha/beta fold hydrolase n=1 Tax=Parasphingorhabdus sp. TaxID=2709688 RepID=UPI00326436CF
MASEIDFSVDARAQVKTSFGSTALVDVGRGLPTVFIHGVGQSAYFWRYQLEAFQDQRRCIAVDLMAHGYTEALPDTDVSFREQANMILAVLDEMHVGRFDLVLNDSGGAVGQIMAVNAPDRVRSIVFSNCDVHDNWPPETLNEIRTAAQEGKFADQIGSFLNNVEGFHTTTARLLYNDPTFPTPEALQAHVAPIVSSPERKAAFNRYVGMQDHLQLVEIEDKLRQLQIPACIVWGNADPFFPIEWANWLYDALPLAQDVIELDGYMLFHPEEHHDIFNSHIGRFWSGLK